MVSKNLKFVDMSKHENLNVLFWEQNIVFFQIKKIIGKVTFE